MLHVDGKVLVQGKIARQIEITAPVNDDGYGRLVWQDTSDPAKPVYDNFDILGASEGEGPAGRGSLAALVEMRDVTIKGEIKSLDNMTMNFVDLVNEAQKEGYGLNGKTGLNFFTEHHVTTNVDGTYDSNGAGQPAQDRIFRINGVNKLQANAQIGLAGTLTLSSGDAQNANATVTVNYFPTDTVQDVINRINNSGAEVTARLNNDGVLQLKGTPAANPANPDFVIRQVADTGRFLNGFAGLVNIQNAAGGQNIAAPVNYNWQTQASWNEFTTDPARIATAPTTHPSGWVEINAAIKEDPSSIAAGYGVNGVPANPGNGAAAQAIASIRNTQVMVGKLQTFDDYFADAVGRIGTLGEQSGRALETADQLMKQLADMRQSVSGVNMDEELSNMLKFQHGYQASARFISTMNSIYGTLVELGA
jgi:flagellar hook-associated protein 1 FlgK